MTAVVCFQKVCVQSFSKARKPITACLIYTACYCLAKLTVYSKVTLLSSSQQGQMHTPHFNYSHVKKLGHPLKAFTYI